MPARVRLAPVCPTDRPESQRACQAAAETRGQRAGRRRRAARSRCRPPRCRAARLSGKAAPAPCPSPVIQPLVCHPGALGRPATRSSRCSFASGSCKRLGAGAGGRRSPARTAPNSAARSPRSDQVADAGAPGGVILDARAVTLWGAPASRHTSCTRAGRPRPAEAHSQRFRSGRSSPGQAPQGAGPAEQRPGRRVAVFGRVVAVSSSPGRADACLLWTVTGTSRSSRPASAARCRATSTPTSIVLTASWVASASRRGRAAGRPGRSTRTRAPWRGGQRAVRRPGKAVHRARP